MNGFWYASLPFTLTLSTLVVAASSSLSFADQATAFSSPEELASKLKQDNRDQQFKLATLLRLHSFHSTTRFADCHVRVIKANLKAEAATSLIQVKCGYDVDLLALEEANGAWHWVDTVPLWAAYDEITVDLVSLVAPPVQEVVVHKHCTLHGSGIYYGHFLVLKLIAGRLRVIFNALERGVEAPFDAPDRTQTSTFTLTPATNEKSSATIEETAQYRFSQATYTIKRSFAWDDGLKTFLSEVMDEVKDTRRPEQHH